MNSELEGYQDQLLSIRQDAPGLAANLSDAQFNWRPAPNRWSIAECFNHLNATAKASLPAFDRALADARARGRIGAGPFSYSLIGRLLLFSMEPPPRVRMPAPRAFAPAPERNAAMVMAEFQSWQDEFLSRLKDADGLDLQAVRVKSPALSVLSYSLGIGFAVFLAHERRHLWQARQVRTLASFPAAAVS